MGTSSMLYTMGLALGRAADLGYDVEVLVDGHTLRGQVAAYDGTGLVLEQADGVHSVVRAERVAAVTVSAPSPYAEIGAPHQMAAAVGF